jgi:hypothetical protein
MQALPLLSGPFKSISIDFIVGLLLSIETRGTVVYNALLVIVDKYTKAATYILCKDTVDALALA